MAQLPFSGLTVGTASSITRLQGALSLDGFQFVLVVGSVATRKK